MIVSSSHQIQAFFTEIQRQASRFFQDSRNNRRKQTRFSIKLSSRVKIYFVFHAFLLKSYHVNVIIDRNQSVPSLLEIDDHEK